MARALKEAPITTANARKKLEPGEYARRLDGESALWYRKSDRGGSWFARWRNHGAGANYKQTSIGIANDLNDKPVEGALTFLQAEQEARIIIERARVEMKALAAGPVLTVRGAVESYIADRDARDSRRAGREKRSDASRRLSRYLLGQKARGKQEAVPPAPLAAIELHVMRETDLNAWRSGLPETMKGTTRQRLFNDVKAALNGAYSSNRDRLDPTLPAIIKHGLRADSVEDDDAVSVARDNQVLTDGAIAALIRAAREIDQEQDWEGDLFRLIVVLAATGARFSQVVRMRVADCQREVGRLMVPASRKGRGGKRSAIPVPVGDDVLDALLPITTGRAPDDPLLERWRHMQVAGSIRWQRAGRGPWQATSEMDRPWASICARAGQASAIPYSLRHSSIVRGIRANLPIRLVAALHDTSVLMIERHYARWIVDGLEELAQRAVVPLVPDDGDNVVRLRS